MIFCRIIPALTLQCIVYPRPCTCLHPPVTQMTAVWATLCKDCFHARSTFNGSCWESEIHSVLLSGYPPQKNPSLQLWCLERSQIMPAHIYVTVSMPDFQRPRLEIWNPLCTFIHYKRPHPSNHKCNARNSCNKQINIQLLCGTREIFIWFLKFLVAGFLITVPWSLKKPLRVSL